MVAGITRGTKFEAGGGIHRRAQCPFAKECRWCELYDVGALAKAITGNRQLVETRFYHPPPVLQHIGPKRYAAERAYLQRIQADPAVIMPSGAYMAKREKWMNGQKFTIWQEKQTDVLLSSDLVYLAAKGVMDVAIVASADADICPAIRRSIDLGVPVEILRFRGGIPRLYELEKLASSVLRARPSYFAPY